ncbi:MAG: hypothetical protein K2L52_02945 [Clostridia bacterium]|nr:hypothetical protein [Clostridia bacterium]
MKIKIFGLYVILCLTLVLCFVGVFTAKDVANAENVDVLVSLADDSLLTAYGDYFAYTNGKSVYLAKDNKLLGFEEKSQFDGFLDIAMNSTHILALAQNGDEKYLWAYEYNDMRIAKVTSYTPTDIFLNYVVSIYANQNGEFFAMETNKVNSISLDPNVSNSAFFISNTGLIDGLYKDVKDFVIDDNVLYCIIDGDLYVIDEQNFDYPDLSSFHKRTGDYIDISVSNGQILLLNANGVYHYDKSTSSISTLTTDGLNANGRICSAYDSVNDINYVYTKSNINAVNVYVYSGGNLEYYGCFDNNVYTHPTEYDIVKLYKAGADVTLYSSPRHLQRMGIIPSSSYFIALSERDDYLYVYYNDAQEGKTQYGYIKKTANITLCPAKEECQHGSFLQPLHPNTAIYKYPFVGAGSEKLLDAPINMQLVFIDNVGQDGNFSWGWYKVGFVDKGKTIYGYIQTVDVSKYTELYAPSLSKSVKLTSKKLGQYITLYALPFENEEDAIEVAQLAEGTQVYLKEKFNKKSQWTAVYYEGKTAYVRTANVKASGLTSWQLVLVITIPCVVIAIAIAVTLIVVAKKKKHVYNY